MSRLADILTGAILREATIEEADAAADDAEARDGGGTIEVDGRTCYVVEDPPSAEVRRLAAKEIRALLAAETSAKAPDARRILSAERCALMVARDLGSVTMARIDAARSVRLSWRGVHA